MNPTEQNLPSNIDDDTPDVDQIFAALASDKPEPPPSPEAPGSATPAPAPTPAPGVSAAPTPPPTEPAPAPAPVPPSPAPSPAPPGAPTPAPAPPGAPPPQPAPPGSPAPAPAVPATPPAPAPAPAPTPEPAAPAPASEVDVQAAMAKQLTELTAYYALPAEEAAALQTEPEVALPKLAARVHQAVQASVYQTVMANLPRMVEAINATAIRESEAKQVFYARWPNLRQHEKAVVAAGQVFRAINPNAGHEDAIEKIGMMVCQSLGLPFAPAGSPPPVQPAPAPVVVPTPTPAPVHRPAGIGATGLPPGVPSDNLFTQLSQDD